MTDTSRDPALVLADDASRSSPSPNCARQLAYDPGEMSFADSGSKQSSDSSKSKRRSRHQILESRLGNLETDIATRFDQLFAMLKPGGTALKEQSNNITDATVGMPISRPSGTAGACSVALSPCSAGSDDSRAWSGIISLQPGQRELHSIGLSSVAATESIFSPASLRGEATTRNSTSRFVQHVQHRPSATNQEKSTDDLHTYTLFPESGTQPIHHGLGLILDDSQTTHLQSSWRSEHPDRITAYTDNCPGLFPVDDKSSAFLAVPSLDDIFEPLLRNRHGPQAVRSWGSKGRKLYGKPMRMM